jgi:hypothetical protein
MSRCAGQSSRSLEHRQSMPEPDGVLFAYGEEQGDRALTSHHARRDALGLGRQAVSEKPECRIPWLDSTVRYTGAQ